MDKANEVHFLKQRFFVDECLSKTIYWFNTVSANVLCRERFLFVVLIHQLMGPLIKGSAVHPLFQSSLSAFKRPICPLITPTLHSSWLVGEYRRVDSLTIRGSRSVRSSGTHDWHTENSSPPFFLIPDSCVTGDFTIIPWWLVCPTYLNHLTVRVSSAFNYTNKYGKSHGGKFYYRIVCCPPT